MLSLSLGRLLGRAPPPPQVPVPMDLGQKMPATVAPASTVAGAETWSAQPLAISDQLWGPGFNLPGGEEEVIRLVRPMALTGDHRLLLAGAGAGGAACAIMVATGARVTSMERDPAHLTAATGLVERQNLGKRATMMGWDLARCLPNGCHHCLALEPLAGEGREQVLACLANAIKLGGHLVIIDLIAMEPLDPADETVRRWSRLEQRAPAQLMAAAGIEDCLKANRLDLRIAEDMSERHASLVIQAWQSLVATLGSRRPDTVTLAYTVAEAEKWLLRLRLMQEGRLRFMRWHAIKG